MDRSPGAGRGGDVYAFMPLGLYFSFELLVTGSLQWRVTVARRSLST